MCRRVVLWGAVAVSFGVGLLIGQIVGCGFFPICIGIAAIGVGVCLLRKKCA